MVSGEMPYTYPSSTAFCPSNAAAQPSSEVGGTPAYLVNWR
jgi:hypothetical protein